MNPTQTDNIVISNNVASYFVAAIENAVGDDIKRDINMHRFVTHISPSFRIWDFMYTSIAESASTNGCLFTITRRGREMVITYDTASKYVITIMQEKRFHEIKRSMKKRKGKNLHYLQAFAQHYNGDLDATVKQQPLFEDTNKTTDIDEEAKRIVQKMTEAFNSPDTLPIEHHVLILFSSMNYQLTSIRAVMIDTDLDIVCEQSWNKYISASESIVADTVSNTNDEAAYNNPTRGLKLKAKATERQATHAKLKESSDKPEEKAL